MSTETKIHLIDWYDGEVEALVSRQDGSWQYWCLIAWDIERDRRAYLRLDVSQEWIDESEILQLLEAEPPSETKWEELRRVLASVSSTATGPATVFVGTQLKDAWGEKGVDVPLDQVAGYIGTGVEGAIEQERVSRWLSLSRN